MTAGSYYEMLQGLSMDELKKMRVNLLNDIAAYETHANLDHLDIDLDLPSADTVYLKDLVRLSEVLKVMAEKFAVISHAEF